jgi:hypothetical protein
MLIHKWGGRVLPGLVENDFLLSPSAGSTQCYEGWLLRMIRDYYRLAMSPARSCHSNTNNDDHIRKRDYEFKNQTCRIANAFR